MAPEDNYSESLAASSLCFFSFARRSRTQSENPSNHSNVQVGHPLATKAPFRSLASAEACETQGAARTITDH